MLAIPTRTKERDEEVTAEVRKAIPVFFGAMNHRQTSLRVKSSRFAGVKFLCHSPTLKHITGCQTVFRGRRSAGIVRESLGEQAARGEQVLRVERGFKAAHEGEVGKSDHRSRA